jgi:hypothetical protein
MKSLTKSMLFVLMTVLCVALTIAPARAVTSGRVEVNVPFDFFVENTALKAGVYRVSQLQSGVISLSREDGQENLVTLTIGGDAGYRGQEPRLVFTRYGNEAFLDKVFWSVNNEYNELFPSKKEQELVRGRATGEQLSLPMQSAR